MKAYLLIGLTALAACFAGCQSFPTDRIASHQAEYNSWPPDVQQNVRAGIVQPGYTPEQVWIALGDPSVKTQAGPPGNVTEVWVYHKRAVRFGFGIGGASWGRGGGVGGGVAVNGLKLGLDVDGQVTFWNGRVTGVQVFSR